MSAPHLSDLDRIKICELMKAGWVKSIVGDAPRDCWVIPLGRVGYLLDGTLHCIPERVEELQGILEGKA